MNRFKKLVITIMLSLSILSMYEFKASALPGNNVLKAGIYTVRAGVGNFKPNNYKIELITPNSIAYIFIIDKDTILRYSRRFDSADIYNTNPFTIGALKDGDSIIIFGEGEFYFTTVEEMDWKIK